MALAPCAGDQRGAEARKQTGFVAANRNELGEIRRRRCDQPRQRGVADQARRRNPAFPSDLATRFMQTPPAPRLFDIACGPFSRSEIRGKVGKAKGDCKVGGEIVREAAVTFMLRDK